MGNVLGQSLVILSGIGLNPRAAEILAENWLRDQGFQTRRAVRVKWQKVDFFGADVMAIAPDGTKRFVQVTTSKRAEHVRQRRRRLEQFPWHSTDHVYIFQLVERRSPPDRRQVDRFFRVHEYSPAGRKWRVWSEVIQVPPLMTRKQKE